MKFCSCSTIPRPITVHPASTVPVATVLLHFTHCCFCYNFWFLPILTLVVALVSVFFCNFPCTEHLYKPQSVQTYNQLTSCTSVIQRRATVSPLLPFLLLFCFLFHFLGCQTPFDDDKSKDVRLNLPHP